MNWSYPQPNVTKDGYGSLLQYICIYLIVRLRRFYEKVTDEAKSPPYIMLEILFGKILYTDFSKAELPSVWFRWREVEVSRTAHEWQLCHHKPFFSEVSQRHRISLLYRSSIHLWYWHWLMRGEHYIFR